MCERNSRLTLACHRSICASEAEFTDKVHISGCQVSSVLFVFPVCSSASFYSTLKGSDWSDDLSSGVFSSYSSLTDERSFNVDWSVSTNQQPSCIFEGKVSRVDQVISYVVLAFFP